MTQAEKLGSKHRATISYDKRSKILDIIIATTAKAKHFGGITLLGHKLQLSRSQDN